MFASESVVCDGCSFSDFEDIRPGEAVIMTKAGKVSRRELVPDAKFSPCIFEYVYFSRPDSIIDGISVYKCRLAMGEALAGEVLKRMGPKPAIDVIIPVSFFDIRSLVNVFWIKVLEWLISTIISCYSIGPRYKSRGGFADCLQAGYLVPRGLHQEQIYWAHVYHARPSHAQEDCSSQVQCYGA